MRFDTFRLDPALLRGVADLGFSEPTPIQRDAIPPALEGRDVMASAMTGSGKTAAFLLPIIQRLLAGRRGVSRALVLAPTRELAAQIVKHFEDLARHTNLTAAAVFGGMPMAPQERALRRGVDLIVACPGRLLDHMQRPYAALRGVEILVLDEADRMLDMGFLPDIRRILHRLPPIDQTMLFSATLPAPIVRLGRELMNDPAVLDVERPAAPATGVRQEIYAVPEALKQHLLLELLRRDELEGALVFTRTKHRANRLAEFLQDNGVASDRIHGNRSQSQRTRALDAFKRGRTRVLVATDVAARGIDIEELSHVVNFDVPNLPEDYIHRVGRTARAGATGDAITLVGPKEARELAAIEKAVGRSLPRRTVEGFDYRRKPEGRLEIPLGERLAAMRAQRSANRARAAAKKRGAGGPRVAAAAGGEASRDSGPGPRRGRRRGRRRRR